MIHFMAYVIYKDGTSERVGVWGTSRLHAKRHPRFAENQAGVYGVRLAKPDKNGTFRYVW